MRGESLSVWELNSISQSWAETPAIQHNKTQWHIRQEEMPRTLAPNAGRRGEERRGGTEKLNYSTKTEELIFEK